MRIRRRLALYGTGVAFAGMGLFSLALVGLVRGGVANDQDAALASLAQTSASAIEAAADWPAGAVGGRPIVVTDVASADEPFVVVVDDRSQVTYASATSAGQPIRIPAAVLVETLDTGRSMATIALGSVATRVAAVRWQRGPDVGVVVAGQPTRALAKQVAGFEAFLVIALVVTLVVVAIVSWLVTGRAMRPLVALSGTADEIGRTGDLTRRLPPTRARDEVGTLTASFNTMLDRVAASQTALSGSLEAQRRFVADASHELRTPLTSIRTNAGFLRDHPDIAATDRAEAMADIAAEADRMTSLVDDLLVLARADAGSSGDRRAVDLAALTAEVASLARRRGTPVALDDGGPVVVLGDPEALRRLVGVLLDNAVRHGGGEVRVEAAVDGDRARLTVRDHGPGIPNGETERIFERFYRLDSARGGDGTGLGLAIARSIAEAHGGRISASNAEGGGARFVVELPLA